MSDAFALPVKLAKPANLDVEPMLLRKAKIKWGSVANAGTYTIKQTGSKTVDITGIKTNHREIPLDDYLADTTVDTFSVKAVSDNDLYEDSNYSDAIRIVDNPILRADGDNSSLASSETTGNAIVKWTRASGASKYSIRYRKMGGDHTQETWNNIPFGSASTATPSSSARSHTLTGLELEEVYAIQLNYEQNGQKVFSGRDAYVWPSRGLPPEDERVATYPYFGHWPDREFTYRICENTFPTSDKAKWVALINHAFEQWETATDDLITVTHDTTIDTCASTYDRGFLYTLMRQYPHHSERLHTNDVYMVDDSVALMASALLFSRNFIGDVQGVCVFLAPACVISKAYGSDAEASTELSNAVGSKNGVDILLRKSAHIGRSLSIPTPKFNQCFPRQNYQGRQIDGHSIYLTALHEAGHALGTSGFSGWDLLNVNITEEMYRRAHPKIPDAVMNYDDRVTSVSDEPDCSPHPFDILAIWALYQTVDR